MTRVSSAADRPARRKGSAYAKYSLSHHVVIKPVLLLSLAAEYRSQQWVWSTVVWQPSNEPPLYLWRKRLFLQYAVKISICSMNPTVECVFNLKSKRLFAQKPTEIAPLGIWIAENLSSIGFNHKNSTLRTVPSVPSWLLHRPCFNYDMYRLTKIVSVQKFYRIILHKPRMVLASM